MPSKEEKCWFCHKYNHCAKVCMAKVGKKVHATVVADHEDLSTDLENKFFGEMVKKD